MHALEHERARLVNVTIVRATSRLTVSSLSSQDHGGPFPYWQQWVFPSDDHVLTVCTYVDNIYSAGATLNGAVMAFGRGSRFLWNCLHEFAADYRPGSWGWNGPELLTRVQSRCSAVAGASVQVEPPEAFYPLHWGAIDSYADGLPQHSATDAAMWATIQRSSYAVHVWNRKTAGLTFARGSVLHRLHNTFMVLPGHEECT